MVRKSRGRQKIEIKKIEKESNLQVTFSKRKFGLFKKASELCTLCGVKILMIMCSPSGKVYSFGNPNVKDLINSIKCPNYNHFFYQSNNNLQLAQVGSDPHIQSLNDQLMEECAKPEELRKGKKVLIDIQETKKEKGNWWEKDSKDLNLDEIHALTPRLQDLMNFLLNQIAQHSQQNVSQNHFGGEMLNNNVVLPTNMIGAGNFNGGLDYMNQGGMMMTMQDTCDYNQNMMMFMQNAHDHNQSMMMPMQSAHDHNPNIMMHVQNTHNRNQDMMMPMQSVYNHNQNTMMPMQNAHNHNQDMMMPMQSVYNHNPDMMMPMQRAYDDNQNTMMSIQNAYDHNSNVMIPMQNAYDHNRNTMMHTHNAYDHNGNMMIPNNHGQSFGYDNNNVNDNIYEGLPSDINLDYLPNYNNFNQS